MKNYQFYGKNSILNFGKYKGKQIGNIINSDTSYILWALFNVDYFVLEDDALEYLCESAFVLCPWNNIDPVMLKSINTKKKSSLIFKTITDDNYDWDDDKPTYGKYIGSYAQDYEGLSDQVIDDAFEGDPDAYWNID